MKQPILLAALSLLSLGAFAQSSPSFGIKAGLVNATISGDAANSLSSAIDFTNGAIKQSGRTGFYTGVNVSLPLSNTVSIEPGIYYAQKGYELKGELGIKGADFIGANAKARLTTHYIDIPVLVKANFGGLEVFAGPQVSYLANADLRTTAGLLGFNLLNRSTEVTDQFNKLDAGLTGGIGYRFGKGVSINASYDHGLSRIDAGKSMNAYNRAVKVGIGYAF